MVAWMHMFIFQKQDGNTPNILNIEVDASKQGSTAVPSYERWIRSVKTQKSNSFKKTQSVNTFLMYLFLFFLFIFPD